MAPLACGQRGGACQGGCRASLASLAGPVAGAERRPGAMRTVADGRYPPWSGLGTVVAGCGGVLGLRRLDLPGPARSPSSRHWGRSGCGVWTGVAAGAALGSQPCSGCARLDLPGSAWASLGGPGRAMVKQGWPPGSSVAPHPLKGSQSTV